MSARLGRRAPAVIIAVLATIAVVASCAADPPPSSSSPTSSPGNTVATPAASSTTLEIPDPGQPFDAADIRAAMAASRRPGGVPAELQTDPVAEAVAEALWTFDGSAWPSITAGGTCGPDACSLELAGRAPGSVGEDVWVFGIDPESASVVVEGTDLHSVPAALAAELDARARVENDSALDGMLLTSVRWVPPPDGGTFVLAYRSGNEEGSCSLDVVVDARSSAVTPSEVDGC